MHNFLWMDIWLDIFFTSKECLQYMQVRAGGGEGDASLSRWREASSGVPPSSGQLRRLRGGDADAHAPSYLSIGGDKAASRRWFHSHAGKNNYLVSLS